LSAADLFAEQPAGAEGGEQRLHADDQRGDAGRQAMLDRDEDAAEIDGMDQHAGNADVQPLLWISRPRRAGRQRDERHQRDDEAVAGEQKGQRFGVRQAVLGADEAGAPEEDEENGIEALHQTKRRPSMPPCL